MKLAEKERDTLARKHFLRRQRVIASAVLYDDVARPRPFGARAGHALWPSHSWYRPPEYSSDVCRVGNGCGLNPWRRGTHRAVLGLLSHEPLEPILVRLADGALQGRLWSGAEVAAHFTAPHGKATASEAD